MRDAGDERGLGEGSRRDNDLDHPVPFRAKHTLVGRSDLTDAVRGSATPDFAIRPRAAIRGRGSPKRARRSARCCRFARTFVDRRRGHALRAS